MINSKGSVVVVGGTRTHYRLGGVVVVPDGGGQGQDALQDPGNHPAAGAPAVAFQVKLAFEGVVDRLDDLAQRPEEPGAGPFGLTLASRAEQDDPGFGQGGFEVPAGVALVANDDLPGPPGRQRVVVEDV